MIEGSVLSADGQPIPGAEVLCRQLLRMVQDARGRVIPEPNQRRVSAKVRAGASGTFTVSNLPEGEYVLCASAPGFLDCRWSGWLTAKVAAGAKAALPAARLPAAAVLRIRVNDPLHLLPADDRMLRPLVTGVMDEGGAYHAAERVSTDATGRDLEVPIPYSRPLHIWIQSWRFRVTDAKGLPIDSKGTCIPLRVEPGTAVPAFALSVVGEL